MGAKVRRRDGRNRPSHFKLAFFLTLVLRIIYSGSAALSVPFLKLDPRLIQSNQLTGDLMQRTERLRYAIWGVWERFDTLWYRHIANNGYDRPEAVVFYPLYPALIRAFSTITNEPLAAALLISTVASFFLFWGFQKLLALDFTREVVVRSLMLWAVWPASFIFFAAYPESLVLALIVWSVYFARAGQWWWAGIIGLLAGLAKAAGLLVAIPLAVIAWREKRWRTVPASLCLLAPIIFAVLIRAYGQPNAFEAYPKYWNTNLVFPWVTLFESIRRASLLQDHLVQLNLGFLILIIAISFSKILRLEYTLFALAALMLVLTKKTEPLLQSTIRYVLAVFPAYINLAHFLKDRTIVAASLVLLFLFNIFLMRTFFEWSLTL